MDILIYSFQNILDAEPAPGHLHQGGIGISRGGTNHVGGGGGGGGGPGGKRACSLWSRAVADAR